MSAFPDPPSTPPRGSVNLTSATPTGVIKDKKTEDSYDFNMSSEDELVRGPSKKVKLTPRFSAGDAEENDIPFLVERAASPEDEAPATFPVDADAECFVATPPPTSPPLGPHKWASFSLENYRLPAATVPDTFSAGDEPPTSRASTPSEPWCASDYPVFDPDDPDFDFGTYDGEKFTDPCAYKEHIMGLSIWGHSNRMFTRHLQDCLQGSAATWYREELTEEDREDLRDGPLEDWLDALRYRFSRPPEWYLEKINENPLDLTVVRQGWDMEDWMAEQFNRANPVSDEHWEALHMIWESIDPALRQDVPEPDKHSQYWDFLEDLEDAYEEWRRMLGLKPKK